MAGNPGTVVQYSDAPASHGTQLASAVACMV
jgi:hypothetical protein